MRMLVAPDSFKDALSAQEAAQALQEGIRYGYPEAKTTELPLADGGEGTARLLCRHHQAQWVQLTVHDAVFRPTAAGYGWQQAKSKAFIDLATASGLEHLSQGERNPLFTTTLGTGELIRDALARGAKEILIGAGGSATNDGGLGIAHALGYRFFDGNDRELRPIGSNLSEVSYWTLPAHRVWEKARIEVLCDVGSPFAGPAGAALVFARQKGASREAVDHLEAGLQHLAALGLRYTGVDTLNLPGAGAAGGAGGGMHLFLGAHLTHGAQRILKELNFLDRLKSSQWLITGEGCLDASSLNGKLISALVAQNNRYLLHPMIVFCGACRLEPQALTSNNLIAWPLPDRPMHLEESLRRTRELLVASATQFGRLVRSAIAAPLA